MRSPGCIFLILAAVTLAACQSEPQIPGGGRPYVVHPFGGRYALTTDPIGRPLEIWDLSYPRLDRDDAAEAALEGDWGEENYPVRLVNFEDPGEMDRILEDEAWSFGVQAWFGGVISFGVIKWFMTTELFDVREIRRYQQAQLAQHLLVVGPDDPELRAIGLDPELHAEALRQLRIEELGELEANVVASAPLLEGRARDDFALWLETVGERAEDALDDEEGGPAIAGPAWARFHAWLDDPLVDEAGEAEPEPERAPLARVRRASELAIARQEWLTVHVERFGESDRLAFVQLGLEDRRLPMGIYELGVEEEPQLVLMVCDVYVDEFDDDAWMSLAMNEVAAVIITVTGYAIGEVVGFPFPFIGLTLNTISSIWPKAPFDEEDLLASSRGRIAVSVELAAAGRGLRRLPGFLVRNGREVAGRIEGQMLAGNRFAPGLEADAAIVTANFQRIARGSALAYGPRPPAAAERPFVAPER